MDKDLMARCLLMTVCVSLIAGCSQSSAPQSAAAPKPALVSGLELQYFDDSVRPQDDLYRHVNGKWLASFEIPADKSDYDQFTMVHDQVQQQLRTLVEGLQPSADAADPDQQQDRRSVRQLHRRGRARASGA